jgi:hypothetical protein
VHISFVTAMIENKGASAMKSNRMPGVASKRSNPGIEALPGVGELYVITVGLKVGYLSPQCHREAKNQEASGAKCRPARCMIEVGLASWNTCCSGNKPGVILQCTQASGNAISAVLPQRVEARIHFLVKEQRGITLVPKGKDRKSGNAKEILRE